jgi:hypothetical protein
MVLFQAAPALGEFLLGRLAQSRLGVLGLLLLAAVPWASGRATPGWPSVRRRSHPADDSGLTAQQPQYGLQ